MVKTTHIQIISDIHLENLDDNIIFEDIVTINNNNILCLLGDIGDPRTEVYVLFIKWCSENFKKVLFVAGNHEYYGLDIYSGELLLEEIFSMFDNVYFLNNSVFEYNNILFLGTTLWTYVPPILEEKIDNYNSSFKKIEELNSKKCNILHFQNLEFLNEYIQNFKDKYIIFVLSHHAPIMNNTTHWRQEAKLENYAYACDLSTYIEKVSYWAYGHTHYNNTNNIYYYNNIPLISNQRGNIIPIPNYNPNFFIQI